MLLIGKGGINRAPDIDNCVRKPARTSTGQTRNTSRIPRWSKPPRTCRKELLTEGASRGCHPRYRRSGTNELTRNFSGALIAWAARSRTVAPATTAIGSKIRHLKQRPRCTSYGSAKHHEKFAESLVDTGADEPNWWRFAAARSEGTHPSAAVITGKGVTKARKTRTGISTGAERIKSRGPQRAHQWRKAYSARLHVPVGKCDVRRRWY